MYNDPIIKSDLAKINKRRRKNIRISVVMDEMDGRINKLPTQG